jgi:ferredoxin
MMRWRCIGCFIKKAYCNRLFDKENNGIVRVVVVVAIAIIMVWRGMECAPFLIRK